MTANKNEKRASAAQHVQSSELKMFDSDIFGPRSEAQYSKQKKVNDFVKEEATGARASEAEKAGTSGANLKISVLELEKQSADSFHVMAGNI